MIRKFRNRKFENKFINRRRKNINESLSDFDNEVIQWAKDHIEDRLPEMEGMRVELDSLADQLTEQENADGSVFYNTEESWKWISEHRLDAGEIFEKAIEEFGSCPNPLSDPEVFCVVWLTELVREILAESDTVNNGGRVKLTEEIINKIIDEIA